MLFKNTSKDRLGQSASRLDELTRKADLAKPPDDDGVIQCVCCAHQCRIKPGKRGVCKVRYHRAADDGGAGELRVPFGYVAGVAVDPIEKKPLFHVMPGCEALSFGMLGCNLRCSFCQNWQCSQTLRDPNASDHVERVEAERIVEAAVGRGAPVIASTYNEPIVTAEWAREIMALGKERGLRGAFVSNGFAGAELLDYMRPALDIYKVDLKTFQDENYRAMGGRLEPVLDTIRRAREMGYWVEVVTLVIPGFNDSDAELRDMAQFIAGVSTDIPWHLSAFHPDYKHDTGERPTTASDIERGATAGADAGLKFVYAGNLGGALAELENTLCPDCRAVLVGRGGYRVSGARVGKDGKCPDCGADVPGIWG